MVSDSVVQPLISLSEAQAFLRMDKEDEEALLAGFIRTASSLCEQFVGQVIIVRPFRENLPVSREWQRLQSFPVRSVTQVSRIRVDGTVEPLGSEDYAIDIDQDGRGWVRCLASQGVVQVEVAGTTGMAANVNAVPEPLRQGVLRLVAHLYVNRDGPGGEPPAAVTALWRPYRRMSLR